MTAINSGKPADEPGMPGQMCLADRRPRADALEADALVKVRNG
jgi:hypothetical protein